MSINGSVTESITGSINRSTACHTSSRDVDLLPVCLYSSIFIVGVIFNLVALVFFFRNIKSRSQTIVYMTNLAVADVLLLFTLPVRIYYHLGFSDLPQPLCEGLGLVLKANMYGSIFLLTSICLDRCMAVSFPMSPCVQGARKKAWLVCVGIWVLTFGASLPIYLSNHKQVVHDNCFDGLPVYATLPVVLVPTLLLGFGTPLVLMLVCSWGLVRAVRRSTVAQTRLVDCRKIQRMIGTSLLVFLFSFLPYHAALTFLSIHRENISCPLLAVYRYSLMVACLNTVLDPIAYYFTTETFRGNMDMSAVWRMFPLNSQSSEVNSRIRVPNNS
ncbi:lysophosphatidic acid receptor 6 [Brachyistius frenatus]|uniref:lysophosphatidic acid receptor 6 n=1 Tax=Brachyistius frenatus TaxID=100188 RepID=UPI0037E9BCBF